jgi:hypothetical protein
LLAIHGVLATLYKRIIYYVYFLAKYYHIICIILYYMKEKVRPEKKFFK